MLILGLDPDFNNTGWGLIRISGSALSHVGNGVIKISREKELPENYLILSVSSCDSRIILT